MGLGYDWDDNNRMIFGNGIRQLMYGQGKPTIRKIIRGNTVGFSIGTKGYIGSWLITNEFWEYDPATNIWTQKASLPGHISE